MSLMPTVQANGIELYYDRFGDGTGPALLMVNGLGSQCIRYDEELCEGFADRGFDVIRYDNRDVGLSTHLPDDAEYTLGDMAADAVGLLDALEFTEAHVWGCSMGGMIVQQLAIDAPERVATLTSVMSTTGEREYAKADPDVAAKLMALSEPAPDAEAAIERGFAFAKLVGSPQYFDEERERGKQRRYVERAYDPAGSARQMQAVMRSGHRVEGLRALAMPALVVHGTADPLIDIIGGRRTAELIPGASFVEIEGMGHDLPSHFWSQYVEGTTRLASATAGS
jgi:pimeloyl-ACP methyl ester carboxylesterase